MTAGEVDREVPGAVEFLLTSLSYLPGSISSVSDLEKFRKWLATAEAHKVIQKAMERAEESRRKMNEWRALPYEVLARHVTM